MIPRYLCLDPFPKGVSRCCRKRRSVWGRRTSSISSLTTSGIRGIGSPGRSTAKLFGTSIFSRPEALVPSKIRRRVLNCFEETSREEIAEQAADTVIPCSDDASFAAAARCSVRRSEAAILTWRCWRFAFRESARTSEDGFQLISSFESWRDVARDSR